MSNERNSRRTCFLWIVDGRKNPFWWARVAYSMYTLNQVLRKHKADLRVLAISDEHVPARDWIERTYGKEAVIPVGEHERHCVEEMYACLHTKEFSPCILLRLLLPWMKCLSHDRIISVDADAEWYGGADELVELDLACGIAMARDPYWSAWKYRLPFGKLPTKEEVVRVVGRYVEPIDPYYSAGLIVFDKQRIRDELGRKIGELIGLIREDSFGWPEQDILNIATLGTDWVTDIPARFNRFAIEQDLRGACLIQYAGAADSWQKKHFDKNVEHFMNSEVNK